MDPARQVARRNRGATFALASPCGREDALGRSRSLTRSKCERMAMAVAFPALGSAALPHRARRPTDPSEGARREGPRHPTLPASDERALDKIVAVTGTNRWRVTQELKVTM